MSGTETPELGMMARNPTAVGENDDTLAPGKLSPSVRSNQSQRHVNVRLVSPCLDDEITLIAITEAEMASLFNDPICGHQVDPATAFASEEHDGRTYYFDSRECHDEFLADPHRFGHGHSLDDPRVEQDEITGP